MTIGMTTNIMPSLNNILYQLFMLRNSKAITGQEKRSFYPLFVQCLQNFLTTLEHRIGSENKIYHLRLRINPYSCTISILHHLHRIAACNNTLILFSCKIVGKTGCTINSRLICSIIANIIVIHGYPGIKIGILIGIPQRITGSLLENAIINRAVYQTAVCKIVAYNLI